MSFVRFSKYYACYFVLLTALVMGIQATDSLPPQWVPACTSFPMFLVFAFMSHRLLITKPEPFLQGSTLARRWIRLLVYLILFLASVAFPANVMGAKDKMEVAWMITFFPGAFLLLMTHPILAPHRLKPIPGTTDSKWRGFKYIALNFVVGAVVSAGVVLGAVAMGFSENVEEIGLGLAVAVALLMLFLLHRLIVVAPHSRFEKTSTRERYARWGGHAAAYVAIVYVMPGIVRSAMGWNYDANGDITLATNFWILMSAAYGVDGSPFRGMGPFRREYTYDRDGDIVRRRLAQLREG